MSALWDADGFTGTSRQALELAELYERWAMEPWHAMGWYWDVAAAYRQRAVYLAQAEAAMSARYGR